MLPKQTRKLNIVPGMINAIGFGRKRGGAGAVAAALAACAVIACLTVSAVGTVPEPSVPEQSPPAEPADDGCSPSGEFYDPAYIPSDDPVPVPSDSVDASKPTGTVHGAPATRLPR